ncbi:MAG: ROK family protein [Candidatus Cyclobacteriaceae bacterium M3_2C_046]
MEKFIGVDFGGTNVKFGVVTSGGKLLHKKKYSTLEMDQEGKLVENFIAALGQQFNEHKKVSKVGIGIPGTLTKDRSRILETPNVTHLNGVELLKHLQEAFPDKIFHLENDANAAALGELYFSEEHLPDNFIFITLGTGIGGAAIIDKQIFKGGDGNALEVGHIISSYGNTVEQKIGKKGLVNLVFMALSQYSGETVLTNKFPVTSKILEKAAQGRDELAMNVFAEVGTILGEALVSTIRILDIKTVVIGGGVADNYDFLVENMSASLSKHLTSYYTDQLQIKKATLGNNAGIIGAASLCFTE